jgi:hypothetical protein
MNGTAERLDERQDIKPPEDPVEEIAMIKVRDLNDL